MYCTVGKYYKKNTHTNKHTCPVLLLPIGHVTPSKGRAETPLQSGHRREIARSLPHGICSVPAPHTRPHTGGHKLKITPTLY